MPPTALLESLRAIGRKVRLYGIAIGAWRILTAAVGLLVGIVLIDYLAHETGAAPGGLPGALRLTLELAALAALAFWLFRWVVRPAVKTHSVGDVAGWVEERYPQFGDTLGSTVNFLSAEIPGSTAMKDLVVRQATDEAAKADFNDVIDRRPLYKATAAAIGSVLALLVLTLLVGPEFRRVAGSWLLHPLSGEVWPKTVQIALDGNLPPRIAVGEPLPVRVKLARGDRSDRRVTVRYRYDEGRWQEQVMDRGPDGSYAAALDTRLDEGKKTGAMQVAVVAGDDEIALTPVTIVPRLDISLVEADVTSPAYVHAANQSKVNLTERPAVMAFGSTVDLQLHFNKPLAPNAPVEITPTRPDQKFVSVQWDRPAPDVAIAHFPADQSFRFTVHATDTDNFRNIGAAEYELIVREDSAPTVQIEEPRRSEDHTAVAEFPLKAVAEDDYGILHAQLVVQRISASPTTKPAAKPEAQTSENNKWVVDLLKDEKIVESDSAVSWVKAGGTVDRIRYELGYDWDLSKLPDANLKPGDVLEYFVQVKDNFDLNGRQHDWVPSGKLRITIISQEQFATAVQTQLENFHSQLSELRKGQLRNRTETEALRQMTQRKPALDEADRVQAERLAAQQSNTASQTAQIAQRLNELAAKIRQNKAADSSLEQTSQAVQQKLQDTAEGSMKEASRDINDARDQKADTDPAARQPQAADAQRSQQQMARAGDQNQQKQPSDQARQEGQQNQQDRARQNPNGQDQSKGQQGDRQQNSDQQKGDQQQGAQKQNQQGQKQQPGQQQNGQQQSGQQQSGQQQPGQQQSGQQQSAQQQDQKPQSQQTPSQKLRDDALAKATENQQKAADQVQDAMNRLGNFDGISEFKAKLTDLKDKQSKLREQYDKAAKGQMGKRPDQLPKDKRDDLDKLSKDQQDLAKQTETALDQMGKKADQVQRTDQNSAQAMRQAAQTGNQQQVPGKQQQASQSMQQNQQAQAEQAQQQAEIGLQMVINKLAEAERRKLEELQTKLAEVQQLMEDLVRRQAGHNIDNLLLQGGDQFKKMETADREALLNNALREEKDAQDARTVRDLNTSQRVTERNARDVAKKAEELPDPAPAAKITVAAGHMERAIVSLNNEKLAEAYQPPQVDAYNALLEAKSMIDKALNKAQEDLNQQKKESIRQAYAKLLDDQKKIGVDIKSIDAKSKEGALPRPTAIRLGQLPGDQGGLSDRAGKLGEQLQQLDSIVYVWANTDIVKTMDSVKDDLAKPTTDVPTQAEETRIEEQLQAMIDSLKLKPRKSDFNERQQRQQQQQPGQSGKPKPRMPGEAELTLLKALQQAVNKSTTTIDSEKTKDKPKLFTLGGRQGDLRDLLDKMIQKASQGKLKLAPEPDNRDQLPEEAPKGAVEDQELTNQLLNQKAGDDEATNSIKRTGDRMARSRQRLALNNDPGKVTQDIQKRIVFDIDDLINQARQQQQQMQQQRKPGQRQQQQQQQPNRGQQQVAQQQQNRQQGENPAQQSTLAQGDKPTVDLSQDLKAQIREWGKLHGRERDAIVEGQSEKVNPKYLKLVEDYFKSLNEKATEQQR